MDDLLERFNSVKVKRRTTYKKVQQNSTDEAAGDDDCVPTSLAGNGFLFGNATVDKIKNRLNNEDHPNSSIDVTKSSSEDQIPVSQSQLLSTLYDGGEDLESLERKKERKKRKEEQKLLEQKLKEKNGLVDTHVDYTQVIYANAPVRRSTRKAKLTKRNALDESDQHTNNFDKVQESDLSHTNVGNKLEEQLESKDVSRQLRDIKLQSTTHLPTSTSRTRQINYSPTSEGAIGGELLKTQTVNARTQATQVIHSDTQPTQLVDTDTQPTQIVDTDSQPTQIIDTDTQPTQLIDAQPAQIIDAETQPTQIIDTNAQPTQIIDPDTQPTQLINYSHESNGKHIPTLPAPDALLSTGTSLLGLNIPLHRYATAGTTSNPKHKNDSQHIIEDNIATMRDRLETQEFQPTVADDVKSGGNTLKIHEIQTQIDEETRNMLNRGVEHRKSRGVPSRVEVRFTKESFMADFEESDSASDMESDSDQINDTTPETGSSQNSDSNKARKPTEAPKTKRVTGLSSYETILRNKVNDDECLDLGSDDTYSSEEEYDKESKVSQASKAAVLNIKAKALKKKAIVKAANTNKTTLDSLFSDLKKKNRQQILSHQAEIIGTKGINHKDLEREKEIVEDLLEQEILRNKRLREREREREQKEEEQSDMDNNYSANELESFDDSDHDSLNEDEPNINDDNNSSNGVDSEDEEEFAAFQVLKGKKRKNMQIQPESDSEEETVNSNDKRVNAPSESKPIHPVNNINAIDLGDYGNNLEIRAELNNTEKLDTKCMLDEKEHARAVDKERLKTIMKEKKLMLKRAELKEKGVSNFFEEEAEESEDEWHGIGGIDGEVSDEYDSEVEKMIDDYSRADMDPEEIRKLLVSENKEMDVKMVNKILFDIKNGNFRKRGRDTLELELSDEEDDDLRQYRQKRNELMKQRLLDLGDDKKLVKNVKTKAFFDSLVEDIVEVKNPFGVMSDNETQDTDETTTIDTQTRESVSNKEEKPTQEKGKKTVLSEEFVQRSLSFLNSNRNLTEFEQNQDLARLQHDDDVSDLYTLKKQSSVKSFKSVGSKNEIINVDANDNSGTAVATATFRPPSIIKSFNSKLNVDDKFRNGKKTVKTFKSYKAVGGSKTSVTYMNKVRKLTAPKSLKKLHSTGGERKISAQTSHSFKSNSNFDS
ncbi:chromatin-modulating protein MRC1 KNAG_0C00220 [Huiozyma naganishii CBS 8797]|uniref:DNA replication checkpoint mediator MRC1 domain-containing protein n=1 Tax=Huiozyma naganishii (strain ATCC MYA-139 / BCRC 22969 / CBS 8797 / KCTC 17520 / NBRC 10181 / NCYC 3082 / Yp74L-3) TaxID=1071383 RepID=J7R2T6_HUIN7|nr:hypothetical protein KNAG_0C00220 [Kazachstania naganishii CBS 8797]CCK69135.1 hypothetical protein KNAG_0C00220 [Kazachstania naganishii CBS 8797]